MLSESKCNQYVGMHLGKKDPKAFTEIHNNSSTECKVMLTTQLTIEPACVFN